LDASERCEVGRKRGGGRSRGEADHYTRQARRAGYPARSVYKLEEIQRRFHPIGRGGRVLDLGAAPGSWSLYCLRELGSTVVAVDLQPLELTPPDPARFTGLRGDVLTPETRREIVRHGPYNAVLSDAAPSTTGNRIVDAARSFELARAVLDVAPECLDPGGGCVIKVFQGGDETEILSEMKRGFREARGFKPRASRGESFEMFLVGVGFIQKSA